MPRSCRTRRTGSKRAGKRAKPPLQSERGQARALEGIRTLARAQRASQRTGRGKLQPIGVAGENVCLSGKTGSDRRRVKTTLLTRNGLCVVRGTVIIERR